MKKFLKIFAVCLTLFACSLSLFACDKNNKKSDVYTSVTQLLTEFDQTGEQNKMFVTTDGQTYTIKYYADHTKYNFYNDILTIPMTFIKNNASSLQKISLIDKINKQNEKYIDDLRDIIPLMSEKFEECTQKYGDLNDADGTDSVIVEGYLMIFNRSMEQFVDLAYQTAILISSLRRDLFNDYYGLEKTNFELDETHSATLRDYFMLYIAYDYYKLLFANMKGNSFDIEKGNEEINSFSNFIAAVKTTLNAAVELQTKDTVSLKGIGKGEEVIEYDNTKVSDLLEKFELMQRERQLLYTSLDNFSLYDFYVTYSCNMLSAEQKVTYAQNYYNEIRNYFNKYITQYFNFVSTTITKG